MLTDEQLEAIRQDSIHERFIAGSDVRRLIKELRAYKSQTEELKKEFQKVNEDYKALITIMDRARKLAFLAEEEEEPGPRFKMDANGNLTRIERSEEE